MVYCSNCGNKLSNIVKFCEKCGEIVVRDNESKIEENVVMEQPLENNISSKNETFSSEIRPKRRLFSTILKWTIGVIISLIVFGVIGYLNGEPYPKNSEEMGTYLTDKCWKLKKVEILSINYNGEYISNPNSDDVRKSLIKAANVVAGTDKSYIWEEFQKIIEESISDKYNFVRFTKLSDGKFLYYSQSFDKEINKPKYDYSPIEIITIENKYEFNYINTLNGELTFSDELISSGLKYEKEDNKIIGLSPDLLKIKSLVEGVSESDVKIILECTQEFENQLNSNIDNFNRIKQLYNY
ncbi:MAG: zinc ribbon domain-containing protein [Paludibacter sp.]